MAGQRWRRRWGWGWIPALLCPLNGVRVKFLRHCEVGAASRKRSLPLGGLDEGLAVSLHADVTGSAWCGWLIIFGGDASVTQVPQPVARAVGSVPLHLGDGCLQPRHRDRMLPSHLEDLELEVTLGWGERKHIGHFYSIQLTDFL